LPVATDVLPGARGGIDLFAGCHFKYQTYDAEPVRRFRLGPNRPLLLIAALAVAFTLALPLPAAVQLASLGQPRMGAPAESLAAGNLASAEASLAGAPETASSSPVSHEPAGTGATGGYRWTNASYVVGPVAPSYRSGSQMAWDASDGYVLLFGGFSASGAAESDTWTYLNGTWTNITSSVIGHPPPTARASMAYDPSTQSVILFGGDHIGVAYENYTWSYHSRTWTNLTSTAGGPPVSIFSSMAADPTDGELLAVVEFNTQQTWTFKAGHWSNITASSPPPLQPSVSNLPLGLSPDPADGGVLLLSEFEISSGFYGATYLFKAGAWQNLTAEAPNAPIYPFGIFPWSVAPLAYLPSASAVLYYETLGMNRTGSLIQFPETWMFSSDHWTNVSGPAGPGPDPWIGGGGSGAVDPADSAFVAVGGFSYVAGTYFWIPTWVLSAPPVVAVAPAPTTTDVGAAVQLRGSVTFGLEPNNATWSFGDGSVAVGSVAAHTYTRPGLYNANLSVTDLIDQTGTGSGALVVNPRPVPSFSFVPSQPVAGGNITFVGTVSGGTPPFSYSWSLDDGTTSHVGAVITHAYANKGSYLVNLTVTDSTGAFANATMTVTVAASPGSSGSTIDLTSGVGLALVGLVVALAVAVVVLGILAVRRGRKGLPPSTAPPPPSAG
jgi:chitodextrinase